VTRAGTGAAIAAAAVLLAGVPAAPGLAQLTPPPAPVIDADSGQMLSADDADQRRAVASTVKVLTALTVIERADLDAVVTVGDEVEDTVGASVDLQPGERWTVRQLLLGLLVRSGNDAAEALATHVGGDAPGFAEQMRRTADAVGLPTGPGGIEVVGPSGLDDVGNRLSARDLATLARVALADDNLAAIVATDETTLPGVGTEDNRNLLIGRYRGATGVKTGFTEAAGNSLVGSASRGGRGLIAVVLGGGADPERFVDARALLDHGFEAFEAVTVEATRTLLVAGGQRTIAAAPVDVTVPAGAAARVVLPLPARSPDPGTFPVPLWVDDARAATVPAQISAEVASPEGDAQTIGRALVDGVHVALRTAHGAEVLPDGNGVGPSR
jgi:D-alanyl-D-alanine carboxypeptidase